jgi:hypothetical protein
MRKTRVVNIKHEKCDIYIGRGTKWGNPFSWLKTSSAPVQVKNRKEAIEKCRQWILGDLIIRGLIAPTTEEILRELKHKRIGCHCKPQTCHGDVYKEICDNNTLRVSREHLGKKDSTPFGWMRPGIMCDNCGDIFDQDSLKVYRRSYLFIPLFLCTPCLKIAENGGLLYPYMETERVVRKAKEEKRLKLQRLQKNLRRRQLRAKRKASHAQNKSKSSSRVRTRTRR